MATTTNYAWETPDDTDLVKDGAAAIRTLGSSIDTTTKALNPSTTLGDIEYRSSTANTNTRLGIGSTGQVLTVAGGVPSWAAAASTAKSYSLLNAGGTALTGSTTVTVSGISGIEDLLILVNTASSANASAEFLIRFNGDTGTNYSWLGGSIEALSTYGAGVVDAVGGMTETSLILGKLPTSASGKIRAGLKVSGCSGSGFKVFQATTGSEFVSGQTNQRSSFTTGLWNGSAVTSVSITSTSGNLDGGTIYVYGAA